MRSHIQTFFDAALISEEKATEAELAAAAAFARGDLNAQNFNLLLAANHRRNAEEKLLHASNWEDYEKRLAAGLSA